MAPNLCGIGDVDHLRSIELARDALGFAKKILRIGGSFVTKVFQGRLIKGSLVCSWLFATSNCSYLF